MTWGCEQNMIEVEKYKGKKLITAVWNIFSRGTTE